MSLQMSTSFSFLSFPDMVVRNLQSWPTITRCLDIWENMEGSQMASLHIPLPALFPGIRSLSQITLLVTGPGIVPAHHWASVSMLCQPCNYSNKTITSTCGNQGAPHPLDSTNTRPASLLVSSVPGVAPCAVASGVPLPWL